MKSVSNVNENNNIIKSGERRIKRSKLKIGFLSIRDIPPLPPCI